ncbi:MAG: type II toxin-antitoxin system mRNA interferase toxin, RelE/StbE family [Deltaproteobacteria bacterium]|nr:type II toxin-antitoxin system mRNA interferase toxin, RelE/StbE family [Deltaproteobacteria bacterium]
MTIVRRTKKFEKDLAQVPSYLRDKVIFWVELVEMVGLREVRIKPGFHDEPLKGKRTGQRSVRLNISYRLIYREIRSEVEILLIEVTKHAY